MKYFICVVSLLISFSAFAENNHQDPNVLFSLDKMVSMISQANPAANALVLMYIAGTIDSFRTLKYICPFESDEVVFNNSISIIGAAYAREASNPNNLELSASSYLTELQKLYPCETK